MADVARDTPESRGSQRADAPGGYSLIFPPGWVHVMSRSEPEDEPLDPIIDESLALLPDEVREVWRAGIETRLRSIVTEARALGVLDVYAPVMGAHGLPMPVSLVVKDTLLHGDDRLLADETALLLTALAAGPGVTNDEGDHVEAPHGADGDDPAGALLELPLGLAARTRRSFHPAGEMHDVPMRRVVYQFPVPQSPGRWMTVTAVLPDGLEPMTSALTDLIDAIMTTWRWTSAPALF